MEIKQNIKRKTDLASRLFNQEDGNQIATSMLRIGGIIYILLNLYMITDFYLVGHVLCTGNHNLNYAFRIMNMMSFFFVICAVNYKSFLKYGFRDLWFSTYGIVLITLIYFPIADLNLIEEFTIYRRYADFIVCVLYAYIAVHNIRRGQRELLKFSVLQMLSFLCFLCVGFGYAVSALLFFFKLFAMAGVIFIVDSSFKGDIFEERK